MKPLMVACPGWSGTVNGADGARVEISACPDPNRPPLDIGPERTLFFRVRMENIGAIRTPAGFASGTGLLDSLGQVYLADLSRSLPIDPAIAGDPQLDPGEQADLALVVPIRRETVPLQLSVVHPTSRLSIVDWTFSP
ncbi:hypothetical protein [Actinoplanes sp. NPDC026670]|uniref:hypothetical protein n=1 Tax=Actinoplanes sp. NPDC026670 TaxID=3154700 RepID=UPI0033C22FA3